MATLKEIEDFMYTLYLNNGSNFKFNINNVKNNFHKNTIKKQQKNMDHYKVKSLTDRLPFELNNVILKQSNIHGRGVFTNKNINKGDLITFYPGDILEYYPNKDRYKEINIQYKDNKPYINI